MRERNLKLRDISIGCLEVMYIRPLAGRRRQFNTAASKGLMDHMGREGCHVVSLNHYLLCLLSLYEDETLYILCVIVTRSYLVYAILSHLHLL